MTPTSEPDCSRCSRFAIRSGRASSPPAGTARRSTGSERSRWVPRRTGTLRRAARRPAAARCRTSSGPGRSILGGQRTVRLRPDDPAPRRRAAHAQPRVPGRGSERLLAGRRSPTSWAATSRRSRSTATVSLGSVACDGVMRITPQVVVCPADPDDRVRRTRGDRALRRVRRLHARLLLRRSPPPSWCRSTWAPA